MLIHSSPLLRLVLRQESSLCLRCARKFARGSIYQSSRPLSSIPPRRQHAEAPADKRYFLANGFRDGSFSKPGGAWETWMSSRRQEKDLDKDTAKHTAAAATPSRNVEDSDRLDMEPRAEASPSPTKPRRRGRLKTLPDSPPAKGEVPQLPLDASSTLSSFASSAPPLSMKRRLAAYLALTKPRLAFLIVLTTTASYSIYPVPQLLSASATHTPSLSTLTLFFLTTGTFGTIASANTLNMLLEPAYDAQMSRTRNRPLVRGLISTRSAIIFAVATAVLGTGTLWYGVNPTTAVLGASNIAIYAFIYTPLKRVSVINTWAGAVVGAIPPLMGWCAAGGHYVSATAASGTIASFWEESKTLLLSRESAGGWLLAALLFAWQFPHFNALSHGIRHEYFNAGYKMCASLYPALNARVALRYSALMFPICVGLAYAGVTDNGFIVTSSVINGWMLREAYRFWKTGGGENPAASKMARGLFWASVWHLPLVLVLAMAHKKGLWEGIWRGIVGEDEQDEDEWEYDD